MRLRTGDSVLVIRGRDRGKQGAVQQVFRQDGKVLVEGVNVVTKHAKATGGVRQAGIIQKELPIQASNLMLVCVHCNEPTRAVYRFLADSSKARICKKCDEVIE
jgi:large subunit ribosomal protein L24